MRSTKIIAFANNKGGSGKSTTASNVGAALALSGNKEEGRKYRKDLCRRIRDCFRNAGDLSAQNKVFLRLYYHLPCLYNLLIRAKVKARGGV